MVNWSQADRKGRKAGEEESRVRDSVGEEASLASQTLLSLGVCIKWRSCPTDQPSSPGNLLMSSGVYKVQTSMDKNYNL